MARTSKYILAFMLLLSICPYGYCQISRDDALEHHKKGRELMKEGKYEEARLEFQKALEMYNAPAEGASGKTESAQTSPKEGASLVKIETPAENTGPAAEKAEGPIVNQETPVREITPSVKKPETSKKSWMGAHKKEKKAAPSEVIAPLEMAPVPQEGPGIGKNKEFLYRLEDEDQMQIAVWQNADLTTDVIIRPDGRISFPLIGELQASGRTVDDIRNDITERLKEYIRYPQVFVALKKFGGKKAIILGEVSQQGVFEISKSSTVLELLGKAGGFTPNAVASSVILIRGGLLTPSVRRLNLTKALDQGDIRDNVLVESQDVIFVPKKFIANLNYFMTQILEPLRTAGALSTEATKWYYQAYYPGYIKKTIIDAAETAQTFIQR